MQQRGPIAWQWRGLDGNRLKREVDRFQEDPAWHANNTGSWVRMGVREGGGGWGRVGVATSWR